MDLIESTGRMIAFLIYILNKKYSFDIYGINTKLKSKKSELTGRARGLPVTLAMQEAPRLHASSQ